ncbi:MAG: hypothetical protein M9894_17150 [Planctomycetes bacterium]|nr:hypothetical protein [Planctomycetota bacterium]
MTPRAVSAIRGHVGEAALRARLAQVDALLAAGPADDVLPEDLAEARRLRPLLVKLFALLDPLLAGRELDLVSLALVEELRLDVLAGSAAMDGEPRLSVLANEELLYGALLRVLEEEAFGESWGT